MKNLNHIHLSGLRAVEAVGRLGTLGAAAEELGVTVGAVSQQVLRTEERLGRPVFRRVARGLQKTPLGEEVCARLTAGMEELSRAVALAEQRPKGVLTISVAPIFASKWLVWRLAGFRAVEPDVRVRIDADVEIIEPGLGDVDACIRVGRGGWSGVDAMRLIEHRISPVCHPDLAARLNTPADLMNVPVIREMTPLFDPDVWLKQHGLEQAQLGDGPVFSDGALGLDAAISGQGVFMAWETLAADALARGSIVEPFPERVATGIAYWFVTAKGASLPRHVRRFRDWLKAELVGCAAVPNGRS
ncbi:LysR substrate-binding domain-containing protein [Oricola sp.]|uniref:LysR substrate-binding domain-containing protein n=1 Tax=Oricola sp. TaxID=1979950 RepID=UPI003BAA501F